MAFLAQRRRLFALAVLAAAVGCAPIRPEGKSPLLPVRMSPDSVALDIFFAHLPEGAEDVNGPLWNEIDEQHFPVEIRRRLAQNGFRVGLVGDRLPSQLSRLLEVTDQVAPADLCESVVTDLGAERRPMRRHLQLRANQRSEIVASEVFEELPVFTCDSGGVCGRPYPKAQAVFALKSYPERDGRVRLELTPEIQYGETQQRFTGRYGAFKLEPGRPTRDFDNLALSAVLAPGEMIVMSSLPDRPGSLGYHFFCRQPSGKPEQRLLVIRLTQTQHDDSFSPPEAIPLDLKVQEGQTQGPRTVVAAKKAKR